MKNFFLIQSSKRILKRPEDYLHELNFPGEDIIMCIFPFSIALESLL